MEVRFEVLGPLRVWRDGHPVELGAHKERTTLATLLVAADRPVAREAIIDALWQDGPPASAVNVVQTYIKRLRKTLGADVLVSTGSGYRLRATEETSDLIRMRRLAWEADDARRARDHVRENALLGQAVALWRGPVLDGLDLPSVIAIEQELIDVVLRHDRPALPRLVEIAGWLPLNEPVHARLIRAYHLAGRPAEAVRVFDQMRVRLREELGVDPGPELAQAHRALLTERAPARTAHGQWRGRRPELDSLVGREEDLRALSEQIPTRTLVTLVGPGGAGKTTLAIAAADGLAADYPDGVTIAELGAMAPETEGGVPLEAVADAVRVAMGATAGPDGAVPAITEALRGRQALLVIDNAEHVATTTALLVDHITRQSPALHVLVTSRRPLGLPRETVWQVPPLSESAAAELFRRRADRSCPGMELDDKAVTELCRRLDGLPLAIELAAARLRAMSLEALIERLSSSLLSTGNPVALPHQRTLGATIEWSLDLLSADQRLLMRRLGVFRGSFDLLAAEHVCGHRPLGSQRVASLLGDLVDHSLVQVAAGGYRVLTPINDHVATLSRSRADEVDMASMRDRHLVRLASYADGFDRAQGGKAAAIANLLRREHPDVAAALAWAFRPEAEPHILHYGVQLLTAGEPALTAGMGSLREWALRALQRAELLDDAARVRLQHKTGELMYASGRFYEAYTHLAATVEAYDDGTPDRTRALMMLAAIRYLWLPPDIVDTIASAIKVARGTGMSARLLPDAAAMLAALGHLDQATALLAEAEDAGASPYLPKAAYVTLRAGRLDQARRRVEAALEDTGPLTPEAVLPLYLCLGLIRLRYGEAEEAKRALRTGAELARRWGWSLLQPDFALELARIEHHEGNAEKARELVVQAMRQGLAHVDTLVAVRGAYLAAELVDDPKIAELADRIQGRTALPRWPLPERKVASLEWGLELLVADLNAVLDRLD